jgi:2-iminobutanoate/2-iminopropanoate deaminase
MSKIAITSPELAPPAGPFSQAIEVGGFLYISGQVGQDPATGRVVEGGIAGCFENCREIPKDALRLGHRSEQGLYQNR